MQFVLSGQPKGCLQHFEGLRRIACAPSLATSGVHARRQTNDFRGLRVSAAAAAEPAVLPVLTFDGQEKGSETLSLKVAAPWTAGGVVHRCMVTQRQNARRVRLSFHVLH
jgi:hypothetical protein